MDWYSLFSTLLVIFFVVMMLRGCGGMNAGGGCGMHVHRRPQRNVKATSHVEAPGEESVP